MNIRRDVRDWIIKAEEDFESAKTLIQKRTHHLSNAVCFHAQQCAEKYLKALLTSHRIPFPKTHDLIDLLELAKSIVPTLELLRANLEYLQPYAVDFRYPGDFATRKEAVRALRLMSHIRDIIRDQIQSSLKK